MISIACKYAWARRPQGGGEGQEQPLIPPPGKSENNFSLHIGGLFYTFSPYGRPFVLPFFSLWGGGGLLTFFVLCFFGFPPPPYESFCGGGVGYMGASIIFCKGKPKIVPYEMIKCEKSLFMKKIKAIVIYKILSVSLRSVQYTIMLFISIIFLPTIINYRERGHHYFCRILTPPPPPIPPLPTPHNLLTILMTERGAPLSFYAFGAHPPPPTPMSLPLQTQQYLTILMTERRRVIIL